jgi:hypothetical protein
MIDQVKVGEYWFPEELLDKCGGEVQVQMHAVQKNTDCPFCLYKSQRCY